MCSRYHSIGEVGDKTMGHSRERQPPAPFIFIHPLLHMLYLIARMIAQNLCIFSLYSDTVVCLSDAYLTTLRRLSLKQDLALKQDSMSYKISEADQPRGRGWLQILFGMGLLLSLLVGLAALLGIYLLNQSPPAPNAVVLDADLIQPAQIPPQLALLQLTGASADALAQQATNARERSLAFALIRYDDTLTPSRRAAEMVRLGAQFVEADELTQAVGAYRIARTVAVLAPELTPLERGQILVQAADGLVKADAPAEAVDTAQQAQHVAMQLPDLLPAQRAQILQAIAPILKAHGSPQAAQQVDELLRNPTLGQRGVSLSSQWATLAEPVPLDDALLAVINRRQAAVQALLDRMLLTGGQDFEAERALVRQILQEEDDLRAQRYARVMGNDLSLGQQHTLIQEQRNWVLLKLRIGLGGFGVDLAPDWGAQADALRLSLKQVTDNLTTVLDAQVATKTDPLEAAMLRAEVLHRLILDTELGFYPNAPLGELTTQLESAQTELERLGAPPALPVFFDAAAVDPGFRVARRY